MIEHNVELRYGKKGRHRQQSVVENRNYAIGYALNQRMASIEQITGQTSRDWVVLANCHIRIQRTDT
jgi:hypothetical protein